MANLLYLTPLTASMKVHDRVKSKDRSTNEIALHNKENH